MILEIRRDCQKPVPKEDVSGRWPHGSPQCRRNERASKGWVASTTSGAAERRGHAVMRVPAEHLLEGKENAKKPDGESNRGRGGVPALLME